jgi:hypothetical protein
MDQITIMTNESQFYSWIVDHLHQLGPSKMYPKALVDAAELALEVIVNCETEEEVLELLIPGAHLCPVCRPPFNQAFGLAFHLAREVDVQVPYSARAIQFLAECYRPPNVPVFENGARIGFKVAELHRTGFFEERAGKRRLHLITTKQGEAALGIQVHLRYSHNDPYFDEDMRRELIA